MRLSLLILGSAVLAAPAAAHPAEASKPVELPAEIAGPEAIEKLSGTLRALSKALMNLPVGEVQAAAEGREATEADRKRTVRDLGEARDPAFEEKVEQQVASAKPAMEAAMQALARALPAMIEGAAKAREELERVGANLPRPDYPRK